MTGPDIVPVPEPGPSDEAQQPEPADVSAEVYTVGLVGEGLPEEGDEDYVPRADDGADSVELEP